MHTLHARAASFNGVQRMEILLEDPSQKSRLTADGGSTEKERGREMPINLFGLLTRGNRNLSQATFSEFVDLLVTPKVERRSSERTPCIRNLTIYLDNETGPIPAVMRDISVDGIGLVHDVPLDPGEVVLRVPTTGSRVVGARVKLACCRAAMKHCYISAGPFLKVFVGAPVEGTP
jgi:hypothetical protein